MPMQFGFSVPKLLPATSNAVWNFITIRNDIFFMVKYRDVVDIVDVFVQVALIQHCIGVNMS